MAKHKIELVLKCDGKVLGTYKREVSKRHHGDRIAEIVESWIEYELIEGLGKRGPMDVVLHEIDPGWEWQD